MAACVVMVDDERVRRRRLEIDYEEQQTFYGKVRLARVEEPALTGVRGDDYPNTIIPSYHTNLPHNTSEYKTLTTVSTHLWESVYSPPLESSARHISRSPEE